MSKSTGEFEVVEGNIVPVIVNDVVSGAEASECADMYMDTLRMERCEGEIPIYSMQRELIDTPILEMTEVHINDEYFDDLLTETAECVADIPNGWTLEEFIAILTKTNAMEHM